MQRCTPISSGFVTWAHDAELPVVCVRVQTCRVSFFKVSALQALANRQEEEAREQELRARQNKQQVALYHAALAAARAEAQAAADAQAEEEALQVSIHLQAFLCSTADAL